MINRTSTGNFGSGNLVGSFVTYHNFVEFKKMAQRVLSTQPDWQYNIAAKRLVLIPEPRNMCPYNQPPYHSELWPYPELKGKPDPRWGVPMVIDAEIEPPLDELYYNEHVKRMTLAFCKIMLGFGAKVIAYDKHEDDEAKKLGIKYVTFEEVLKNSDIISLHCPLTPETKYMIDWEAFANMKDGVMLINTSRGALINTKDAILALKRGKIGYLGIDVYEQEEHLFYKDLSENIIPDDTIARLMSFPNVMMTSHQGFFTKEALTEIAATTVGNIDCVAQGKPSPNEVKSE